MNNSWPLAPLGEVLTHRKKFRQISDFENYKRCRVQLHAKGIVLRDIVAGAEIKTKEQQVCRAGEFLVAEIDAKVGGFGVVPDELDGSIVSSHYFLFEVNDVKLDGRFLDYFVRTPFFRDQVSARGSTNYAAIRPHHVLRYQIPLPLLSEQRRIVVRIEELAAKINEARSLRQQVTEAGVPALRNAIVSRVFDSKWPHVRLEDVCSLITDGTHQTPRYVDDGFMFLSAQNVKPFRFMPEVHRKVSAEDYRACVIRAKPQKGDVLMTRVGAMIGEAAIIDRDLDFAFYVSLAILRPLTAKIMPEFLVHWLNSPKGIEQSRRQTLGKGHSQGNLNLKLLRQFDVPLPSLSEQHSIVSELDELQEQVDTMKRLQGETTAELDALLPSILDKAFRGDL
jgi:type I restriction enzyme S subunit